jgi:hypothetical protein
MGTRELKNAFNEVSQPVANCTQATLGYDRSSGVEHQKLVFSGNYSDGTVFSLESNPLRPEGDVMVAARETAEMLLKQGI